MQKPNIVIFNPDQFRADALGHLGNAAAVTPTLDNLIKTDAVSFSRAFCQNPVCTPSRCSFMTGWYPHVNGHRTMYHMLRPHEPVLLKALKDSGYYVWWGGKNDLLPAQNSLDPYKDAGPDKPKHKLKTHLHADLSWRGEPDSDNFFSFYAGKLGPEQGDDYDDGELHCVNEAARFINDRKPSDKPFCLYLPLSYPHPPYGVEEPWYSMIDRNNVPDRIPTPHDWSLKPSILKGIYDGQHMQTWTKERWTELRATYYGMCARIDHQLSIIIDALRNSGVYDTSAILFFSDHGDFTGDYGLVEKTQNTFEDCLTRVPFVIKPPADVTIQPRISDALVELVDFPATVFDFTGIEPSYSHFGKSLRDVISGSTDTHRDAVFCEGGRLHGEEHCMEKQSSSNTQSDGLYYPRIRLQVEEGPEHTKAVMCRTERFKYVRRLYEKDEFYDLMNDPREMSNLIDNPEFARHIRELQDRMLTFFLETGDVVPFDSDARW